MNSGNKKREVISVKNFYEIASLLEFRKHHIQFRRDKLGVPRIKCMDNIENSPEHAAWDSLMKARYAVVHKKGSLNLTFGELIQKYPLTKRVITRVETVLGAP